MMGTPPLLTVLAMAVLAAAIIYGRGKGQRVQYALGGGVVVAVLMVVLALLLDSFFET